jgi:kinesin family protein C2/C3
MEGREGHGGVNAACVAQLLRLAEGRAGAGGVQYAMTVSAFEIYNDNVRDLLVEGEAVPPPLQLHMQADGRSCLPGLTSLPATDSAAVQSVLQLVKQRRATGRTNMNAASSRSHSIVQITCTGMRDGGCFGCGRLNLVDLAGSERLGRSGSDGDAAALREAQAINGSLSALGDVMQALACKRDHVPYRWLPPIDTYCRCVTGLAQEQQTDARAGRQPAARQQGAHDRAGSCTALSSPLIPFSPSFLRSRGARRRRQKQPMRQRPSAP